jgi:pimeloyl-ACP methyl ester carboxylesterase
MSTPYPIVYVRGYAMTAKSVEETFNLPYYGFNLGSTQFRQGGGRDPEIHIFESPVIRLMKDHDYVDAFGRFATTQGDPIPDSVPRTPTDWHRTLWIFRYYDRESAIFDEDRPAFPQYAVQLLVFLNRVRQACGDPADFCVNLVAHSMGGLISRCYLQHPKFFEEYAAPEKNPGIDPALLKPVKVHKLFTFGTPHRGIRFRSGLAPANWLREATGGLREDQFTPRYMRQYLGLKAADDPHVYRPRSHAPPVERTFSLVGTNAADYVVGGSRLAVGAKSDGLVLTENAYIFGGPRAYVHRAHSGPLGIVNSEEGYQNLRRFLFGNVSFQARLRFGRVVGRLPGTDPRDRLRYLTVEVGIAIRGLAGYLDMRNEREFTADQIHLKMMDDGFCEPTGEKDPVLYTGYLFAFRDNRRDHRAAAGDDYSRWVVDLAIKPQYERENRFSTSRFEGDHFLSDRLELGIRDEKRDDPKAAVEKPFVYRWQNTEVIQREPAVETPPAGVKARFVIDLPHPAPRYLQDVQLVLDVMDWS